MGGGGDRSQRIIALEGGGGRGEGGSSGLFSFGVLHSSFVFVLGGIWGCVLRGKKKKEICVFLLL